MSTLEMILCTTMGFATWDGIKWCWRRYHDRARVMEVDLFDESTGLFKKQIIKRRPSERIAGERVLGWNRWR